MQWLRHDCRDDAPAAPERWGALGEAEGTWGDSGGHGVLSELRISGCCLWHDHGRGMDCQHVVQTTLLYLLSI
jgi:hypothetical protein